MWKQIGPRYLFKEAQCYTAMQHTNVDEWTGKKEKKHCCKKMPELSGALLMNKKVLWVFLVLFYTGWSFKKNMFS